MKQRDAKFTIGEVVRHRVFPFRGVVFDVDPEYANTEEWWNAIPAEIRPDRDQPFYHLLAENDDTEYELTFRNRTLSTTRVISRFETRIFPASSILLPMVSCGQSQQ